jgi:hypothetical protein
MAADWQQIGSRLAADWQQIGSRLAADWQQIGSFLPAVSGYPVSIAAIFGAPAGSRWRACQRHVRGLHYVM